MRRFAPLALAASLALPAQAQEMSDAERDSFRAEVRAYLLENPEVLMEAIGVLEAREANEAQQRDVAMVAAHADQLFDSPTSFVGGNPEGDFTIVEFLDYRCGYCKRAHPEVAALVAEDANIRYVIKELPILGEESMLAARYALAVQQVAGDDVYYEVHNTLMAFQGNISTASLSRVSTAFGLAAPGLRPPPKYFRPKEAGVTLPPQPLHRAQQLSFRPVPRCDRSSSRCLVCGFACLPDTPCQSQPRHR